MKFKRLMIIFLIGIFINYNNIVYADDTNEVEDENISIENETIINTSKEDNNKPVINSKRYVVLDRASGLKIYGKDENKQTPMASTTKIMTAIVTLEKCKNLEEVITVDRKSAGTGGSRLGLKEGDKITVNDLLFGLLMKSGNDTAIALAKHIGGEVEQFAELMNDKAKQLGLTNTHFETPEGLDNPNHYTTAYELAKLTNYALNNEKFATMVKTRYAVITINNTQKEIKNTNELLISNYDGVYGVKTGFTNNAGRCLVTAIKRNGIDIIIVVLGADTKKDRTKDTIKLAEYIYKNFRKENIETLIKEEFEEWKNINENRIIIEKSKNKLETKIEDIKIKEIVTDKEIELETKSINYLKAPVEEKSQIGIIDVKNGDELIEQIKIVVSKQVKKKQVFDYINLFAKSICI